MFSAQITPAAENSLGTHSGEAFAQTGIPNTFSSARGLPLRVSGTKGFYIMTMSLRGASGILLLSLALAGCSNATAKKEGYLKAGEEAFAKGEYSQAVLAYKNALKIDPKDGDVTGKLAQAYLRGGDSRQASKAFIRAAGLMPENIEAQVDAGNAHLVTGEFEDAKTKAEQILKKQPKHTGAQILLGYALAGLKDTNGAVKQLQSAVATPGAPSNVYMNLGTLQLDRGAREEAEAAFKTAVANAPNAADTQIALANFYLADGKVPQAENILRKAIEIQPPSAEARRTLADLLVATDRAGEAEAHYVAATAAASSNASHRLALGDYYLRAKNVAKARATFEALSGDKAAGADAALRLAAIDYNEGKHDAAYARIDGVLKTQAQHALALVTKGEFLLSDKRAKDANAAFKAAAAADPQFVRAQYGLGLSYVALHDAANAEKAFNEALKLNPRFAPAQVELGRLQLTAGNSTSALQNATAAVQTAPNSGQARLLRAQALLAKGDLAAAEQESKLLIAATNDWSMAHVQMGSVRMARGDMAGARASFERAQQLAPETLEPLRGLILVDKRTNNLAAAKQRIESRLATSRDNPDLLILAAGVYEQMKDKAAFETTLKRLIEIDPSNLRIYDQLGGMYIREQRIDEAIATFTTASQKKPDAVGPRTMVGYLHHIQGRTDQAQKEYEATVNLDARAAVAANNLAYIYAEKGENLDRALQLVQAAKERMPDSAEVTDTLGWVYLKKGLPDLAIPAFEQCVKSDPRRAEYQYHLGLALIRKGDVARGREVLKRALDLQGDFPGAADARRALGTLER